MTPRWRAVVGAPLLRRVPARARPRSAQGGAAHKGVRSAGAGRWRASRTTSASESARSRALWQAGSVTGLDLKSWLRARCAQYTFDVTGAFHRLGTHEWPYELKAADGADLEEQLAAGGHLLPLPREPAALAKVLEVSLVDFLLKAADTEEGLESIRGTERGYPDIEFSGAALDEEFWAVDVKVARRANTKDRLRTESRITLYTGMPTDGVMLERSA